MISIVTISSITIFIVIIIITISSIIWHYYIINDWWYYDSEWLVVNSYICVYIYIYIYIYNVYTYIRSHFGSSYTAILAQALACWGVVFLSIQVRFGGRSLSGKTMEVEQSAEMKQVLALLMKQSEEMTSLSTHRWQP